MSEPDHAADVAMIGDIEAVPTILEVVCRTTGMGFAAVARVTEDRWIACGLRDDIDFGLKPGGELKVETTICHEVRQQGSATIINHVSEDPAFCGHPTPALYGFQSYISMPIILPDGSFWGTLCAIDPRPNRLDTPEVVGMFKMFAQLVAFQIDAHQRSVETRKAMVLNEALKQRVTERTQERDEIWRVSQDMLLVIDRSGIMRSVNPAWTGTLGYAFDELVGQRFDAFVDASDVGPSLSALDVASLDTLPRFENRYRHKDGSWRDLDWTAAPSGDLVYCVARDVTEEKKRAAALLLHENIVQSGVAPICAFDTDYRLIAFNKAHSDEFFRIYHYRVRIGDVFPDLFTPEQAPVIKGFMARALQGEVFSVTEAFGDPAIVRPYWEIAYAPLRDAAGDIIGAFHLAQDISVRLRAEAELQVAQETLRQSQKMEAVGQLTGGVAHDFNNLLTVIRSSIDLLKRPNLADERRRRYIDAISDTTDRAAKLTGQLLAFARRQALKPEVFDVVRSIATIGDMVVSLTGSRIRLQTSLADGPCYVNADPSQFDTAVINLAVNARDAMDGVGRLVIAVRAATAIPPRRAHPVTAGDFIAVSVCDTGCGIASGDLSRIFEPFFTTKAVGKGTGLGLSQVIGFAKQSGGDIAVESEVGRGTTFMLYLPRAMAPDVQAGGADVDPTVDGHGLRVLVVEDNVDVGSFATQTLRELGYESVLATDAAAGLAELAGDAHRFDVVFSDVIMPGMNGIELAQEVRRLYPALPVVLTSGYSHVLSQNGTYGFELLHKPYSIEQLSRVLSKVSHWRRLKREIGT